LAAADGGTGPRLLIARVLELRVREVRDRLRSGIPRRVERILIVHDPLTTYRCFPRLHDGDQQHPVALPITCIALPCIDHVEHALPPNRRLGPMQARPVTDSKTTQDRPRDRVPDFPAPPPSTTGSELLSADGPPAGGTTPPTGNPGHPPRRTRHPHHHDNQRTAQPTRHVPTRVMPPARRPPCGPHRELQAVIGSPHP
jgi:hypothetical protein